MTMERLNSEGIAVEESDIELTGAKEALHTPRGIAYPTNGEDVLAKHRNVLNPNVVRNIEFGLQLDHRVMGSVQRARSERFYKMNALLQRYDVRFCPVSIVLPFPVEMCDVRDGRGQHFDT
jgi:amidase